VCSDSLLSLFYLKNPNFYANSLLQWRGVNSTNAEDIYNLDINSYSSSVNLSNETVQNITSWKNSTNSTQVYIFVYYQYWRLGSKISSVHVNCLIMGLFQIIASILAFLLRRARRNWKKDMITLILFECFGNVACIANVVFWFYIQFSSEYFEFLPGHKIVHYFSILLCILNGSLKIYLFALTFHDYFDVVSILNMKVKKKYK
jgi:hypothetical protein